MFARISTAASIAIVASVWCWVVVTLHGILSIGIVLGYLEGSTIPLTPSLPVTYGTFFVQSIGAFVVPFFLILMQCSIAPRGYAFAIVALCLVVGFYTGAGDIAYAFQLDFGTTWGWGEAARALFYHPVVTPFAIVFGLLATYAFTRHIGAEKPA